MGIVTKNDKILNLGKDYRQNLIECFLFNAPSLPKISKTLKELFDYS